MLVPDLATEIPKPTDGGLKYTFTLKDGVKFGPPVNRAVTSKDIAYAIERIGTPSVVAQYPGYFTVIKGFPEFAAGKAKTISGIATPNDKTISFTLSKPTGDFLFRMGLPATAPIPSEVAKCHTQAGEYGRFVISTGPYMYEGADKLDISSCASQKPMSGYTPGRSWTMVRNPNYDPATDDTSIRQALPDRFEITVDTNLDDIFAKIERGELETSFEAPPNTILRKYLQNADIRPRLRVNSGDRIWFAYMNLTTPPFDDVHVRKAMNLVMDLEGILRAWGGPIQGTTPTDVMPDTMIPELTNENYTPYQKAPFAGDVAAAKAEMKLSKYDTNKDGLCDAPACKGVIHLNRNFAPWSTHSQIVVQSAAKIGVELQTREASRSTVNDLSGRPSRKIPISSGNGWGKDYPDPVTFSTQWDGRLILPDGNQAFSLVGITPAKAKEVGATIPAGGVPSVDADIDKCQVLTGAERQACWVAFDKKVTEQIAPWVPLIDATKIHLLGPAVTQYDYDQNGTEMSLAHVAVDPSKQK